MTTTALYRFYGADDSLLYVGITHRLPDRFGAHKRHKPWDQVSRISIEHYPNREQALAAEAEAIRAESPLWNVVHNAGSATTREESTMATADGLVGQFFHSIIGQEGCGCQLVEWQGQVVAKLDDTHYYIETYDWLMGQPSRRYIVTVDSMIGWYFYDNDEWMRWEYDEGGLSRRTERHFDHEAKARA